jgi:hypothetical protein
MKRERKSQAECNPTSQRGQCFANLKRKINPTENVSIWTFIMKSI